MSFLKVIEPIRSFNFVVNEKFCSETIMSKYLLSERTTKYIPPLSFLSPLKVNLPFMTLAVSVAYCFPPK